MVKRTRKAGEGYDTPNDGSAVGRNAFSEEGLVLSELAFIFDGQTDGRLRNSQRAFNKIS